MKTKENKTNEKVIIIDKILSKGIHNKGAEIVIEVLDENQKKNKLFSVSHIRVFKLVQQ
jgi:hypothetical protein